MYLKQTPHTINRIVDIVDVKGVEGTYDTGLHYLPALAKIFGLYLLARGLRTLKTLASVTFTAATDVFNSTAHGLPNGTEVRLSGTVPPEFTAGTTYFVVATAANTFQLAATPGGAAITGAADASGIGVSAEGEIGTLAVQVGTATPIALKAATALATLNAGGAADVNNASFNTASTDDAEAPIELVLAGADSLTAGQVYIDIHHGPGL